MAKEFWEVQNRNIPRIVRTLKKGPDFCFHGCLYQNLGSILREGKEREFIFGHYFGVEEKAKQLPNEEFYKRLQESLKIALDYSRWGLNEPRDKIIGTPCLILGVDNRKANSCLERSPINPDSDRHDSGYLNVGHDLYIFEGLDIHPLTFSKPQLGTIEKKLVPFPKTDYIGRASFAQRSLAEGMIRKIYNVIEGYKTGGSIK